MECMLNEMHVLELFQECLFPEGAETGEQVKVCVRDLEVALFLDKVRQRASEIRDMLSMLPTAFMQQAGAPFLTMGVTYIGETWTDRVATMQALLILGLASERVVYVTAPQAERYVTNPLVRITI